MFLVCLLPEGRADEVDELNRSIDQAMREMGYNTRSTNYGRAEPSNRARSKPYGDSSPIVDFKSLPLEQSIKRVNGNGQRVIVTFEDPNCGYCKRLNLALKEVKNVTIYTFIYPRLSSQSKKVSVSVLCSNNKAAAWAALMMDGKKPEERRCDSGAAIADRNLELGQSLRASIPAIFFADGTRFSGYHDASAMEQKLAGIPIGVHR